MLFSACLTNGIIIYNKKISCIDIATSVSVGLFLFFFFFLRFFESVLVARACAR